MKYTFKKYWEEYGNINDIIHRFSMCRMDKKRFAEIVWLAAQIELTKLEDAVIKLLKQLESDREVREKYLDEIVEIKLLLSEDQDD